MLDRLYGRLARWRRQCYERPGRRLTLSQPVISVGNLSVGGTGKTPVTAAIARWLIERGERPAILSRGYGRRDSSGEVVIVSAGAGPRVPLAQAGDEPLMLARAVPGAIVCVAASRHRAGVVAERDLGATVHLLDDGFQHYQLARDLDVLVTTAGEIPGGHVLPRGRLREPRDLAARADVLVVVGADAGGAAAEARAVGVGASVGAFRRLGEPCHIGGPGGEGRRPPAAGRPVVAVCGIANPQRFADDLAAAGWHVVRALTFPDHHPYSPADLARISDAVAACGAAGVFTTDKDAVRLEAAGAAPWPLYRVSMTLGFDPPDGLSAPIAAALASRRAGGPPTAAGPAPPPATRRPEERARG